MSSAYRNSSYLTACGMSFIYRRNRSWSKIDPCWTRHKSYPGSEKDSFKFTLNFLYDKHDLNQRMTSLSLLWHFILRAKDAMLHKLLKPLVTWNSEPENTVEYPLECLNIWKELCQRLHEITWLSKWIRFPLKAQKDWYK